MKNHCPLGHHFLIAQILTTGKWGWNLFLFSIDYQLWKIVKDGFTTTSTKEEEWTKNDIKKHQMDHKEKYIIFCLILPSEYENSQLAQHLSEIWKKLEVVYEGTDQVKDAKINLLTSQYEELKLLSNEI